MIKTKDLRIGNLVHIKEWCYEGDPDAIIVAHVVDELHNTEGYESLDPIPLTEEWLIKLNVITGLDTGELEGVRIGEYSYDFLPAEGVDGFEIVLRGMDRALVEISFVHTFQNWAYAMTGKELTIKQ